MTRLPKGIFPQNNSLIINLLILNPSWFGSLIELVNHLTMLAIILTGEAAIRERENGTVKHLLVMPVSLTEIMLSKVWSMSAAVVFALWLCVCSCHSPLPLTIPNSVRLSYLGALDGRPFGYHFKS
jgi:ABC-2 type transport system permease protein